MDRDEAAERPRARQKEIRWQGGRGDSALPDMGDEELGQVTVRLIKESREKRRSSE